MRPAMSAARCCQGRFAGRTLDSLADDDLLRTACRMCGDADSLRVLEAYLDRRLGADWRNARSRRRRAGRAST